MPFLRVIRDKRGYETTYLMHWFREGNRQRSRILYVFRTPGGVRVGRDPLGPEVLREIEAHHPEIAFEWKVIRDNQQVIEPALEPRRRRPRSDEGTPDRAAAGPGASATEAATSEAPRQKPIPAEIAGTTAAEQVAFLAGWYPVIRERIQARISEPGRQQTLLALAERLNPSAWTDADQITSGLPAAREALERLSRVFARRRRRGRQRSTEPPAPSTSSEPS